MQFDFATATRIIFGSGTLQQIGPIARGFGSRALVVTGRTPARAEQLLRLLEGSGVTPIVLPVAGEPQIETVEHGVKQARAARCDHVIGFGGGSAIDAGKTIAAMLGTDGALLDHIEVIGKGRALAHPGAPFIAVPTTAGTGAEVTRNAVLGSAAHRLKVSLRSPHMLPRVALVDPALTLGLPAEITASTGLDALTQLLEAFVCSRANPITDALCEHGIRLAARSFERAFTQPDDLAAREDMSLAAMYSGIALANAGLGAVHGFAAAIGGMFSAAHGAVCAALLPHVWRTNLAAVGSRGTEAQLQRFHHAARVICGDPSAEGADALLWIERGCARMNVRTLNHYGVTAQDADEIVARATQASSMKANPVVLTDLELRAILLAAV